MYQIDTHSSFFSLKLNLSNWNLQSSVDRKTLVLLVSSRNYMSEETSSLLVWASRKYFIIVDHVARLTIEVRHGPNYTYRALVSKVDNDHRSIKNCKLQSIRVIFISGLNNLEDILASLYQYANIRFYYPLLVMNLQFPASFPLRLLAVRITIEKNLQKI